DALISLVDLKAARVLKTFEVPDRVTNPVLALNGHIYVFPFGEDWPPVESIDVKSGDVSSQRESYLWNGKAIINADGKRMYYVQDGLSPSSVYRIDVKDDGSISDGQKWPYHGDYEACGRLWISQDSKRLLSACGTIFKLSSDPKQDMTYNGHIDQKLFSN